MLVNAWAGCGCLFALVLGVGALVLAMTQGGTTGSLALLGMLGIGGYLAWAYRTNHYDEHGCRIEYLYTDTAYLRYYSKDQVGRDIPVDVAARHPDHILDR